MAINATNNGQPRELIPAGNYVARCYQMIHIGTVEEVIQGTPKILNKVRIGWELPTETKVFKEENGEQPRVISKEFTLSMNEKSNLRKVLASWRGKDFTEAEAKSFDITKLIGAPCMLNLIHKPSKDGTKTYEEISSITPMPKGFECPAQVNVTQIWDYDNPDMELFRHLPDFITDKIKKSLEWVAVEASFNQVVDTEAQFNAVQESAPAETPDDLPF